MSSDEVSAPKTLNKLQLAMELWIEDNMICSLNLRVLLQLSLLFAEVLLLRENPPSTAANSAIQFWITASAIFWALQFELEPIRAPAVMWPEILLFNQLLPCKP